MSTSYIQRKERYVRDDKSTGGCAVLIGATLGLRALPLVSGPAVLGNQRRNCVTPPNLPLLILDTTTLSTTHPDVRRKCSYDSFPSVKMARRPARCYRYCKNKVRCVRFFS